MGGLTNKNSIQEFSKPTHGLFREPAPICGKGKLGSCSAILCSFRGVILKQTIDNASQNKTPTILG